ncbi:MAG TPA: HAD family hydrolase [Symbiobacteriaceae bacterium]
MGFVGHAFVDWDDTIAENIRYFTETEEINCRLIARATGADPEQVRIRGRELDLATARRMGLGRESLPTAWLTCYREFAARAGVPVDPETEAEVVRACRIPYEVRQEILPGAPEVLTWLHTRGFEVLIWTAGDHEVQFRKIRESGLTHLIHGMCIVPEKTPEVLRAALADRDPARCFVVGNSVHSDIRPGLALGLLAIHVPAETWAYDDGEINPNHPRYRRVEGIHEVPKVVADWFRLPLESLPNSARR